MPIVSFQDEKGQPTSLDAIRAWGGAPGGLTPGMYVFEITEVVEKASASKGTPQIEVHMDVLNGDTEVHNGQSFMQWYLLRGKKGALGRTKNLLEACGIAVNTNGQFDTDALVGRRFAAEAFEDESEYVTGTGATEKRSRTRLRNEQALEGEAPAAAPAAAPAPAPAPAPAATPPAQAAAPQVAAAPAIPRAGQRIPVPTRK